ncbi:unnamed protein product [Cylicocyclus nassatus]|uniref:JmjC domain-containing protein n=1 Tax=Cylicocyclus nassatus TaxID=53992 RepID=A0AA36MB44_CYLNA|nr:unnamed protein product [Cylicocyclus nassatus]
MQTTAPVVSNFWQYFTSYTFVSDLSEASQSFKESIISGLQRMYYTKSERRVSEIQDRLRPDLEKIGWDAMNLAKNFKLPALQEDMARVDGLTLSLKDFRQKYEVPRVPCVIAGLTERWKARKNWTFEKFLRNYSNEYFKCGETPEGCSLYIRYKYFAEYMVDEDDDSPLCINDETFGEEEGTKTLLRDYEVPEIFQEDLFDLLRTETNSLPNRKIIIGPARAGTNVNVTALGASAWHALIQGHKRWVFIHPDAPREFVQTPMAEGGIYPKESITWFSSVYRRIHRGDWPALRYPVYECRQKPGEIVFVPNGWWHATINEDDTIAIAQNFCSPVTLSVVYPSIRKKKPALAKVFLERINEKHPELLLTVYQSLLNLKTVDSSKLPDRDSDVSFENDDISYVTSGSTDISEDEESGDFDDEEHGDENSEDEQSSEEEESSSSDDEEVTDQKSRQTVNKKALLEEEILPSSDESDESSESYSDDDDEEEEDSEENESSFFSDIRKEPTSDPSSFRTAAECGVKRRATVSSSKSTAYHP